MPSADRIKQFQALRARFLSALWDAEDAGRAESNVRDVLVDINESTLSRDQEHRLIGSLVDDGLIEDSMEVFVASPVEVRLTAAGRAEVEHWITEPDDATTHLPIPHQVVFHNTFNGTVQGSAIVQGSAGATVTVNAELSGQVTRFVEQYRTLVDELPVDVQEDALADLETLTEQADDSDPHLGRVRPAVRRLVAWLAGVSSSAATAIVVAELTQRGEQILHVAQSR